jgi:hypothetical protein
MNDRRQLYKSHLAPFVQVQKGTELGKMAKEYMDKGMQIAIVYCHQLTHQVSCHILADIRLRQEADFTCVAEHGCPTTRMWQAVIHTHASHTCVEPAR